MEHVGWLDGGTNERIERAVAALRGALGGELVAIALVGDAMNPARADRARHPELIAVASEDGARALGKLADALAKPMREGVRVRVVTAKELDRSRDVFALELAEWRARHRLLEGAEPFDALVIAPADLRRGIETELRGLTRRIRNRVLAGMTTSRDDPRAAIVAGLDRLLVASYHALALSGTEPAKEEASILRAIAERASADAAPLLEHLAAARAVSGKLRLLDALEALLDFSAKVTDWIDSLNVDR